MGRKNAVEGEGRRKDRRDAFPLRGNVKFFSLEKGFSALDERGGRCNLYKLKCDSRWRNRGTVLQVQASFGPTCTHKRRFRRFFHPMKLLCGACRRLCSRIVEEKKKRKEDKIPLPDNFGRNTTIRDANLWINFLFFSPRKLNFPLIEAE